MSLSAQLIFRIRAAARARRRWERESICHPHKKRASSRVFAELDGERQDPHAERWAEIERERARALPQMRDV